MESNLTLYCVRQRSTGYYLPMDKSSTKLSSKAAPRLFTKIRHARLALDAWLKVSVLYQNPAGYDIVPVYVTISKLTITELADLDKADADVKHRIKELGLVYRTGGRWSSKESPFIEVERNQL